MAPLFLASGGVALVLRAAQSRLYTIMVLSPGSPFRQMVRRSGWLTTSVAMTTRAR
ncbi:hypothetical protein KCP70_02405 [Salmonella enterica subsp. enterica]|nr:hypothetical protein KCP70_02405 [Salmonella enterica subsp. enterica]